MLLSFLLQWAVKQLLLVSLSLLALRQADVLLLEQGQLEKPIALEQNLAKEATPLAQPWYKTAPQDGLLHLMLQLQSELVAQVQQLDWKSLTDETTQVYQVLQKHHEPPVAEPTVPEPVQTSNPPVTFNTLRTTIILWWIGTAAIVTLSLGIRLVFPNKRSSFWTRWASYSVPLLLAVPCLLFEILNVAARVSLSPCLINVSWTKLVASIQPFIRGEQKFENFIPFVLEPTLKVGQNCVSSFDLNTFSYALLSTPQFGWFRVWQLHSVDFVAATLLTSVCALWSWTFLSAWSSSHVARRTNALGHIFGGFSTAIVFSFVSIWPILGLVAAVWWRASVSPSLSSRRSISMGLLMTPVSRSVSQPASASASMTRSLSDVVKIEPNSPVSPSQRQFDRLPPLKLKRESSTVELQENLSNLQKKYDLLYQEHERTLAQLSQAQERLAAASTDDFARWDEESLSAALPEWLLKAASELPSEENVEVQETADALRDAVVSQDVAGCTAVLESVPPQVASEALLLAHSALATEILTTVQSAKQPLRQNSFQLNA